MSLRNQVELMWNRLNVPQEDRDKFARDYPGCKPAIIKRVHIYLFRNNYFGLILFISGELNWKSWRN